jgi:AcrR family transcriptional regulator
MSVPNGHESEDREHPFATAAMLGGPALQLADREGLEAVTLRGLASHLGVHVTSLYNHVLDKEAVLDGMVEHLIQEANLPTGNMEWEEWIRRFAAAIRAVAHKHPGAFTVFHHRPGTGIASCRVHRGSTGSIPRCRFRSDRSLRRDQVDFARGTGACAG